MACQKKKIFHPVYIIRLILMMLLIIPNTVMFAQVSPGHCPTPPSVITNPSLTTDDPNFIGDMNYTGPQSNVEGWYVSHGTPSVSAPTPPGGDGNSIWMWSYNGMGEGIYTCYNFLEGLTYSVCLWVRNETMQTDGNLIIKAANGLYQSNAYTFIPQITSYQVIDDSYDHDTDWTRLMLLFTADQNYSQLWVYPYSESQPTNPTQQYALWVDLIEINACCPAAPSINDVPNQELCVGEDTDPIEFSGLGIGGGNFTGYYQWHNNNESIGLPTSGTGHIPSFEVQNDTDSTITATITASPVENGCIGWFTEFTITVHPSPKLTIEDTKDVSCQGNDGEITIEDPDEDYTYTIDNGNNHIDGTFYDLTEGPHEIITISEHGCERRDTIELFLIEDPILELFEKFDISCFGENDGSIVLTVDKGTAPFTYDWTPSVSNDSIAENLAAGTYIITVKDENECESDEIEITIEEPDELTAYASLSEDKCFLNTGKIVVHASGGTGDYTYDWSPNVSTSNIANGLDGGTYTITITDENDCQTTHVVEYIETSILEVTNTIVKNTTCEGSNDGSIFINVNGGSGVYTYDWTPNVSTTNQASNLGPGEYSITITDDAHECVETIILTISENDGFYIQALPDTATINLGESVSITLIIDHNTTVDQIEWTPEDGLSCTSCDNPTATPNETTTYIVTVTSTNGCVSTDTVHIIVEENCGEVFVPDSFSPNDDGQNDFQCVFGNCIVSLEFTIYNRWGQEVFYTETPDECWDGKHKGEIAQSGAYAYKLKASLSNGKEIEEAGSIRLIR